MEAKRRNRGFERAGSFGPCKLGLPAKRARELQLALAWKKVAGEAIARHAKALRVRRGALEIGVSDERWAATMREMLPRLTGRMADSCPELRIRRFRLLEEESEEIIE